MTNVTMAALVYANMIDGRDWFLIRYSFDSMVELKFDFIMIQVYTIFTYSPSGRLLDQSQTLGLYVK